MMKHVELGEQGLVGLRIEGDVDQDDIELTKRVLRDAMDEAGDVRVLLDATREDLSVETVAKNIHYAFRFGGRVKRLAILGMEEWQRKWVKLAQTGVPTRVKTFGEHERDEAVRWLKS